MIILTWFCWIFSCLHLAGLAFRLDGSTIFKVSSVNKNTKQIINNDKKSMYFSSSTFINKSRKNRLELRPPTWYPPEHPKSRFFHHIGLPKPSHSPSKIYKHLQKLKTYTSSTVAPLIPSSDEASAAEAVAFTYYNAMTNT